jgi:molybdopterin synthase sulfur carrier subunit
MATGLIRYWAAARAAAGVAEEPYDATTLDQALTAAAAGRDAEFERVLARSSFLIDGSPVGTRDPALVELADGATVEVLPPFAGG